jgi:hypothetical protein
MGHRGTYWRNIAASAFIFLTVQALLRATAEAIHYGRGLLLVKLILFEVGIALVICGILYAGARIARSLRGSGSRPRPTGRSLVTSDGGGRARLPRPEK